MTSKSKFWPLDYEPEVEIYENLSWDLPGLRRARKVAMLIAKTGAGRKRHK